MHNKLQSGDKPMGLFGMFGKMAPKRRESELPRTGPKLSTEGLRLGNYELCVPQGVHSNSGHVYLEHNLHYSLLMKSHGYLDCDAVVSIDGTKVGVWRIRGNTMIEIERPADDSGRFTFYRLGSSQATHIGLSANEDLGLVTVVFMPEKPPPPAPSNEVRFSPVRHSGGDNADVKFSPSRGGTGLAGESAQKFGLASPIDYDRTNFITINLRLVCVDKGPRPLRRSSTTVPSYLPD